jgi:hypothetical protein
LASSAIEGPNKPRADRQDVVHADASSRSASAAHTPAAGSICAVESTLDPNVVDNASSHLELRVARSFEGRVGWSRDAGNNVTARATARRASMI